MFLSMYEVSSILTSGRVVLNKFIVRTSVDTTCAMLSLIRYLKETVTLILSICKQFITLHFVLPTHFINFQSTAWKKTHSNYIVKRIDIPYHLVIYIIVDSDFNIRFLRNCSKVNNVN